MLSLELWIDGQMAGRIDQVKPGSVIAFKAVESQAAPLVPKGGESCACGSGVIFGDCHGRTEESDAPQPCNHDKVYSSVDLCSMPSRRSWICRKCKARGTDRGAADSADAEYKRLLLERGVRTLQDAHEIDRLPGNRPGDQC